MEQIKLNNGVMMPGVGYGTWKAPTSEITIATVRDAIESGYRLIDCAAVYGNEKEVGQGIQAAGAAREEYLSWVSCGTTCAVMTRLWRRLHRLVLTCRLIIWICICCTGRVRTSTMTTTSR